MQWLEYYEQQAHKANRQTLKQFYRGGCVSHNAPISAIDMVALDIETTGLNPREHDITSIGVVPFSLHKIRFNEAKHWLVQPRRPLNDQSVTIHQITHSDLENAPDFIAVFDQLLSMLQGKLVVAHYHKIERLFLQQVANNRLQEEWLFPMLDTMQLEARMHRKPKWQPSQWFKRPTSIRLADSRGRYQLPTYRNHNALLDALATAELLQAQIAHHYDANQPVEDFWC